MYILLLLHGITIPMTIGFILTYAKIREQEKRPMASTITSYFCTNKVRSKKT